MSVKTRKNFLGPGYTGGNVPAPLLAATFHAESHQACKLNKSSFTPDKIFGTRSTKGPKNSRDRIGGMKKFEKMSEFLAEPGPLVRKGKAFFGGTPVFKCPFESSIHWGTSILKALARPSLILAVYCRLVAVLVNITKYRCGLKSTISLRMNP